MRPVQIAGVGMTPFGRFLEKPLKALGQEAAHLALADAEIGPKDVEAVFFSNSLAGLTTGQEAIRGQTVLHPAGFGGIPIVNVDNACASGGSALHVGWLAVAAGAYDRILVLGAEKLYLEDRERMFNAYRGGIDVDQWGDFPEADRSPFVDRYARLYAGLAERGVMPEHLGQLAVKAHRNGSLNPVAQRRTARTLDEVLSGRVVVEPLTVHMVSVVGDGGAGVVLAAADRGTTSRSIDLLASTVASLPVGNEPSALRASATEAYERAGLGPADLDVVELHDASVIGEMVSWVEAGICEPGDEARWATERHTELGGWLPVNPSGGLLARGHPVGASGLAQVVEIVQQLRGEAGERQIEGARLGMTQVGGGLIGDLTAAASTHILRGQAAPPT